MTKIITSKFRSHVADQFIESFSESANNIYYLAAGRHVTYPQGDEEIPSPEDSEFTTGIDAYDQIVFGKRVLPTDVSKMIPRYNWTSNTTYAMYDDTDGELLTKQFYVVVDNGSQYLIYKVLDNNKNSPSTVQPSSTSESACNFTTADGYTWKLMYKLDSDTEFEKFATSDFMPVKTSANVSGNSVTGALDIIKVVEPGANYVSTYTGQFLSSDLRNNVLLSGNQSGNNITYKLSGNSASNSDFYVGSSIYITTGTGAGQIRKIINYSSNTRVITVNSAFTVPPEIDSEFIIAPSVNIVGDGSGADAYCVVSSNATVSNYISKINVVNRGNSYTYATASISGNTAGSNTIATARVILPPQGGHGANSTAELGSSHVGISVKFSNNENGYVTTKNDFRSIYLLKDPLFDDVTLEVSDAESYFVGTEKIYQIDYVNATGTVEISSTNTEVTGTQTEFTTFNVGDKIYFSDISNPYHSINEIQSITNNEHMVLTSEPVFSSLSSKFGKAEIIATASRTGNTLPYVSLTNVEPKFSVGKKIVGEESGALANVASITVTGKNFNNWLTFDNRVRISFTSNTGLIEEDSVVYQQSLSVSNAVLHSSNATYIALTAVKGTINADPSDPLISSSSNAQYFTLGSVKYVPDIINNSGKILYIENKDPVQRSNNQTETVKIILKF